MLRRTLVVLAVLSFGSLAGVTLAGAQTNYPPSVLGLTLSQGAGGPGTSVTVSGSACSPGATVTVFFDNQVIATTTADPTGAFTTTITIPADAKPGVHTITTSGTGCKGSASFTVPSVSAAGTAFTGANVGGLSAAGVGLALLGAVLVFATRRRRELSHRTGD